MPKNNFQKSLQKCISNIKKKAPHLQISHSSLSSTTSKILGGCKHPKSLSFDVGHKGDQDHQDSQHQRDEAATLEDIDNFLVENFKSLYGHDHDHGHKNKNYGLGDEEIKKETWSESSGILYDDSPRFFTSPKDSDICGSPFHRFMPSPISSDSPRKEARLNGLGTPTSNKVGSLLSASVAEAMTHGLDHDKDGKSAIPEGVEDCIAVLKVSPSPYEDFKRSMKGVLDARIHHNQTVDWDFMEEILLCYLRLNKKNQHKFILSAFVDLVVVLRQN